MNPPEWIAIAKANRLELPDAELEALAGRMRWIDDALGPWLQDLPPGLDPALVFRADPETDG